ncbi:MAG: hypothetical protein IPI46_11530 [Bacteroidetes bacterium]|nr:hypothetical protein [Bacteroidota bacterium]
MKVIGAVLVFLCDDDDGEELECTIHGLFNNSLRGDAAIQQIAIDYSIETSFLHDKCFIKRTRALPHTL